MIVRSASPAPADTRPAEPPKRPKPKSAHRYRICGTPSRLGCRTCKIRRVKCGEEKPFCKRCTSTGRKCDGYGPPTAAAAPAQKGPPKPIAITPSKQEDPMELKLLYFFSTFTAPILSGDFSSHFWEKRVVEASMNEPSVRHALIAIAAVHQDFNDKHHKNNKSYNSTLQAFAFKQYTMAISHLHNLMTTRNQQLDMTLISCILFICFDCLLGNHASAIIHLKAGLKILEDIRSQKHSRCELASQWEREFSPIILSLGVQAATFVNPNIQVERTALWTFLQIACLPQQPSTFKDIDEARYALDTISASIMKDRTSRASILEHKPPDPAGDDGRRHNEILSNWTQKIDRFIAELMTAETTARKLKRGAYMLKIHSIVVSIVIGRPEESVEKFETILSLCEFMIRPETPAAPFIRPLNFSADQGLIAPLFFTALRTPNPFSKRRAIDLLSRVPGREGMWDANDAVRVAETAIRTASELAQMGAGDGKVVAPQANPHSESRIWHDVATRLKTRMTWPFGEGVPDEVEKEVTEDAPTFDFADFTKRDSWDSTVGIPNGIPRLEPTARRGSWQALESHSGVPAGSGNSWESQDPQPGIARTNSWQTESSRRDSWATTESNSLTHAELARREVDARLPRYSPQITQGEYQRHDSNDSWDHNLDPALRSQQPLPQLPQAQLPQAQLQNLSMNNADPKEAQRNLGSWPENTMHPDSATHPVLAAMTARQTSSASG